MCFHNYLCFDCPALIFSGSLNCNSPGQSTEKKRKRKKKKDFLGKGFISDSKELKVTQSIPYSNLSGNPQFVLYVTYQDANSQV